MSNFRAIAAVTEVLKSTLNNGLTDARLTANITAWPPDKIDTGATTEVKQLNLYMYMTMPNQGWRNQDFPSQSGQGQRISNPYLALDLHYVLSAYGDEELYPEQLLGYAMLMFHENPTIARQLIDIELTTPPLSTTGLSKQIEQIKITLDTLSTEEISRLWTSFGAKHRQSAYYKATVLLIESEKTARVALPVKQPLIYVQPFKQPVISKVSSRSDANADIIDNQKILSSYQLVIKGMQLKGEVNSLIISGIEQNVFVKINNDLLIANIPATLKAGLQSIQVGHKINMGSPATPRKGFTSNAEAFILSPELGAISEVAGNPKSLQIPVSPNVEEEQKVLLFLDELIANNPKSYSFEFTPSSSSATITIPIGGVAPGNYLVRLRVDHAESWIAADYQSPDVTIT